MKHDYINFLVEQDEKLIIEEDEVESTENNEPVDELPKSSDLVKKYGIKSPIMDIYGRGERFEIHDNQLLYQIVKMFKDFIDKHFYSDNFKFIAKVAYKMLVIKMIQKTAANNELLKFQIDGVIGYITTFIKTNYPGKYEVTSVNIDMPEGYIETRITIKQKN